MLVQCNGSYARSLLFGLRENHRCPPRSRGRLSQAIRSACKRPPGHRDKILLERCYSERELDLVIVDRTVGAIGAHHEFLAAAKQGRGDSSVRKSRSAEIAKDARIGSGSHRELMMRPNPSLKLVLMAIAASIRACKGRARHRGRR